MPDTLCGVELCGPEHLVKPIVYSECALPGSFFEPTTYDYTTEWYACLRFIEKMCIAVLIWFFPSDLKRKIALFFGLFFEC